MSSTPLSGPAQPQPAVVTTHSVVEGRNHVNQYNLVSKVGQGKNGVVYRAVDSENPDSVFAIKSMKRITPAGEQNRKYKKLRANIPRPTTHATVSQILHSEETKIKREIAIMKKLHHPSIVQLHEVLDDPLVKTIYIVMEYCGGGEVEWKDSNDEPVSSLAQTRRIMRDTINGLDYLHSQGIIHRDIKPANLLWTENRSRVKIADFGTAHFSEALRLAGTTVHKTTDEDASYLLDDTSLAKKTGTPMFMAPEVVRDSVVTNDDNYLPSQPITKAIDIWALGVTLYCLLFGAVPFPVTDGALPLAGEYQVYRLITKGDWTVKDTMGSDKIPTGGRFPVDEESEGGIVMHLLEHMLERDINSRITLGEVRSNRWFLHDLPNPETWLKDTSNDPRILVSPQETSVAIKHTDFNLATWTRLKRGISSVLGIAAGLRTVRSREHVETSPTARHSRSPVAGPSRVGRHHTVAHKAYKRKEKDKGGKMRDLERSLSRLRTSASLSRRSSQKSASARPTKTAPPTPPSYSIGFIPKFLKRDKGKQTRAAWSQDQLSKSSSTVGRSYTTSLGPKYSKSGASARASAEVLGNPTRLTRNRRVSSWGDHPSELRNQSFEEDDDGTGFGAPLMFHRPPSLESDASVDVDEGVVLRPRSRVYSPTPLIRQHEHDEDEEEEDYGVVEGEYTDTEDEGIRIDFRRRAV